MVKIAWHSGTGNDFFVSLYVINHAGEFGLRPSWAAGVRSRLPADQRDFLEQAQRFLRVPLTWLASLPHEKRDAKDALSALEILAPAKRIEVLMLPYDAPIELRETLAGISARGGWTAADLDLIKAFHTRQIAAENLYECGWPGRIPSPGHPMCRIRGPEQPTSQKRRQGGCGRLPAVGRRRVYIELRPRPYQGYTGNRYIALVGR